jgi:hypothetical protein
MAKSDNEQAERVRSARAWLERAEKSFDNKADVRGELNLMLAEAEMKNLRKNHGTGRKIRRLAAVLTALVLALGIWQFMRLEAPSSDFTRPAGSETAADTSRPMPQAQQLQPGDEPEPAVTAEEVPAMQPAPDRENHVQALPEVRQGETGREAERTEPAPETVPYTQPVQKKVLSDRQVQAAVQDARHSLRGAETKK